MSTPGGEKLHQPHIITVQHHLVKVVISELDHIFLVPTTAATTTALLQASYQLHKSAHGVFLKLCDFIQVQKREKKKKGSLPVCSQSHQTCRSASLSPDYAERSWLHPRWPGCCVHLRGCQKCRFQLMQPQTQLQEKRPWKLWKKYLIKYSALYRSLISPERNKILCEVTTVLDRLKMTLFTGEVRISKQGHKDMMDWACWRNKTFLP